MRRKALLAEASSSFVGPWVHLEEGIWEVKSSSPGVAVEAKDGQIQLVDENTFIVVGPAEVRGIVTGLLNGIHLDARQIKSHA